MFRARIVVLVTVIPVPPRLVTITLPPVAVTGALSWIGPIALAKMLPETVDSGPFSAMLPPSTVMLPAFAVTPLRLTWLLAVIWAVLAVSGPAVATKIEQAAADDLVERQGAWAARSTAEIGDDIAERVAG